MANDEVEDGDLLKAARRGDLMAYQNLFNRYAPIVYLFALLKLQDKALLANDVVRATFEIVFADLPPPKKACRFGRYLYVEASRLCAQVRLAAHNQLALPRETSLLLQKIRTLPENCQLPLVAKHVIPKAQNELCRFLQLAPADLALLQQHGSKIIAGEHLCFAGWQYPQVDIRYFLHSWYAQMHADNGRFSPAFYIIVIVCVLLIFACKLAQLLEIW